jgi:CubicO group peptidase (beta-lactamase class C family)
MKRKLLLVCAVLLLLFSSASTLAQHPSSASHSEDKGFSSERLADITTFFQSEIDRGAIPGAVLVVSRGGTTVYQEALGYQDREKKTPMKPNAIFRIASMTKPVTSVAVMMLAEEGKIDLLAPVYEYLPEFKDVKVGVEKTDPDTNKPTLSLEPPHRPITVQDLLRHTSGIVYGPFGNTLVHQAYNQANLFDPHQTLAEFVTKLSKLPLAHQPGEAWEYGMSIDVLGRIVEVVSGMPFDEFIAERITKPLRMPDTGFYLSPKQAPRVAELQVDPATGKRPISALVERLTKENIKWFSGGGGLLSTAADYARFCQMLVNGGELDGVRLLSPKTIEIMDSDQLQPGTEHVGWVSAFLERGYGFGLGFAVRTSLGPRPISGSVGEFFWAGIYGTYFWVDPHEKLYAILMVQMPFDASIRYQHILPEMVYAALVH